MNCECDRQSYGVFIFLWEFLIPLFIYVIAYGRMLVAVRRQAMTTMPAHRQNSAELNCCNDQSGPYTIDDWTEADMELGHWVTGSMGHLWTEV